MSANGPKTAWRSGRDGAAKQTSGLSDSGRLWPGKGAVTRVFFS